ncbi:MAG: GNAT family N-acetyltransferase [Planctomycetota bacterium]|nr:MAG: GNAT family N-acetyltransferase [Planctomycetota bacterium]
MSEAEKKQRETVGREVELTDGRIRIRPCRESDADGIYAAVRESINEVSKWAPWCRPAYSMSDCKRWLEGRAEAWSDGQEYDFVILDACDGALLGGCGLNEISRTHNFANAGYWVRTSRTGQGVATAAIRLVAKFGFEKLGLTRIEIVPAVGNKASQRVAEKAGARREGIERNRHVVRDKIYDAVMFSLVPEDLKE